jgi:hypothetical protein
MRQWIIRIFESAIMVLWYIVLRLAVGNPRAKG